MTTSCLQPIPWETRNLGRPAFALSDTFLVAPDERVLTDALAAADREHSATFVQARFSPESQRAALLGRHGFYFVETALSPSVHLGRCAALQRFRSDVSAVVPRRWDVTDLALVPIGAADADLADAVRAIAAESFVDDRFHHDHGCPPALASRRYALWTDDLLDDATVIVRVLLLGAEPIGFMISRKGQLLLAGFSRRYAGAGLGEFLWLSSLSALYDDGVMQVRTVISTNNVPVLNLYARLGFRLGEPRSTFHRWSDG